MNLLISNNKLSKGFISWLVLRIKRLLISQASRKKLQLFNECYVNETGKDSDIANVFAVVVSCIKYRKTPQGYLIYISDKALRYNPQAVTLCRFLNYGGFSFKGYPIFTKVFSHVKANLSQYHAMYTRLYLYRR